MEDVGLATTDPAARPEGCEGMIMLGMYLAES